MSREDRTTVLITGMGGPTPLSCARALKRQDSANRYRLVGVDADDLAPGLLSGDLDAAYVVPRCDSEAYPFAIAEVIGAEGVEVALVEPEAEVAVWSRWRSQGKAPCAVRVPPPRFTAISRDKHRTAEALADTGLVPNTISVSRDGDPGFGELMARFGDSFWLRATTGAGGRAGARIRTELELEAWFDNHHEVAAFAASEFLPGRTWECILQFANNLPVRSATAECTPYRSTYPGNTRFGVVEPNPSVTAKSLAAVRSLLDVTGETLDGVVTVDLTENAEGDPLVTEINPRLIAFADVFSRLGHDFIGSEVAAALHGNCRLPGTHEVLQDLAVFFRDTDLEPHVLPGEDRDFRLGSRSSSDGHALCVRPGQRAGSTITRAGGSR